MSSTKQNRDTESAALTAVLSAITKRCSQGELKRLQSISVNLLRSMQFIDARRVTTAEDSASPVSETDSGETQQKKPTGKTTGSLLRCCAWSAVAPRFIFLCSPNKLVRSADRGQTWKSVRVFAEDVQSEKGQLTTSTTATKTKQPHRLHTVACCSQTGHVAVAGSNYFVAVGGAAGGFHVLSDATTGKSRFADVSPTTTTTTTTSSSSSSSGASTTFRWLMFASPPSSRGGRDTPLQDEALLFAATPSMLCAAHVTSSTSSSSMPSVGLSLVCKFEDVVASEVTLLRSEHDFVEVAVFSPGLLQLLHIVTTRQPSPQQQQQFAVARKISTPLKIGTVLKCVEVPLFFSHHHRHQADHHHLADHAPPSIVKRRFKWCNSGWRPGRRAAAAAAAAGAGAASEATGGAPTASNTHKKKSSTATSASSKQKRKFDYTVGCGVSKAQVPNVAEFFRINPEHFGSDILESMDEDDDDSFLNAFRGGIFAGTAPRMFACYSTRGPIVASDCTSWLWLWMGDDSETVLQQNLLKRNKKTEADNDADDVDYDDDDDEQEGHSSPAAAGGLFCTATNVSYLPLVESNPATDTVGLSVLNDGRSWVRASLCGVSTSLDGGRSWTEPQLSCTVGAAALDARSSAVVSSRPAFAVLPSREGSALSSSSSSSSFLSLPTAGAGVVASVKSRQQNAIAATNNNSWCLFPLPPSAGCSVLTAMDVM